MAFSSETLISVQCSKGVVDVFLFVHCTLTAGFVIPTRWRNALAVYSVQAFFGGTEWTQVRLEAAMNRANTIIAMMAKFLTTSTFLIRIDFNITRRMLATIETVHELDQPLNTWIVAWLLVFSPFPHKPEEHWNTGKELPNARDTNHWSLRSRRPPFWRGLGY